jgi:phosphoesterase RecJ-like protein
MWEDAAKAIRENRKFVVTTHVNPEGDAIGSEVAFAAFLRDAGKQVTIINSSPTPQNNKFLDPGGTIKVYPSSYEKEALQSADAVVIIDVNNWSHVGPFADVLKRSKALRICIDHHQGADDGFSDIVVSDTTAAAAGVLVYELICHMKGKITRAIADAIYSSIITDTGTFRFSNTDERVFRIAADLVAIGVEPFGLHRKIFSKERAAVELLGVVLGTLRSTPDGRIAWIHATRKMFEDCHATYEDSDGILDVVRAIEGVEYCLFFKETHSGGIKVSLRSNGKVDVYEIARRFDGGGHRMASGMSVDGPMPSAIESVVEICTRDYPPPK